MTKLRKIIYCKKQFHKEVPTVKNIIIPDRSIGRFDSILYHIGAGQSKFEAPLFSISFSFFSEE